MDSLLLKKRIISGDEVCLAAVCDGVGSLESGAVASSLAIQMLIEWLNGVEDTERIGLALIETVQNINEAVVRESNEKGIRTASTLSALLLAGGRYYTAHVGDSRIYACSRMVSIRNWMWNASENTVRRQTRRTFQRYSKNLCRRQSKMASWTISRPR